MKFSTTQKISAVLAAILLYAGLLTVLVKYSDSSGSRITAIPQATATPDDGSERLRQYYAVKLTEDMRADIPGSSKCVAMWDRKELTVITHGAATPNSIARRVGKGTAAALGFTAVTIDGIKYKP